MADCLHLEAEAGAAHAALVQGREAAVRAVSELVPLETQLADIDSKIADAERERAEAYRYASAISSALSQLASQIHQDDTNCPVCRTSFEPGALKVLADAAALGSDHRLAQADDALETLRNTRPALNDEIHRLRGVVAEVDALNRVAMASPKGRTRATALIGRLFGGLKRRAREDAKQALRRDIAEIGKARDLLQGFVSRLSGEVATSGKATLKGLTRSLMALRRYEAADHSEEYPPDRD